jgi:hypothetical protein
MEPSAGLAGEERNNILSLMGIKPQFLGNPVCSFLIIMAIKKSIQVFWDVMPCGLVSH